MQAIVVPQDKKGWSKGEILKCVKDYHHSKIDDVLITDYDFIDVELQNQEVLSSSFKAQRLIICDEKAEIKEGDYYYSLFSQQVYKEKQREGKHVNKNCVKIMAAFPKIESCYELTESDIRWWVENGMPENVNIDMQPCCDMQCDGTCERTGILTPKIKANCIELVKPHRKVNLDKFNEVIANTPPEIKQKVKDWFDEQDRKVSDEPQPSIQDGEIMTYSEWGKQFGKYWSDDLPADDLSIQEYASYYHAAKSVVSKADRYKTPDDVPEYIFLDAYEKYAQKDRGFYVQGRMDELAYQLAKNDSVDFAEWILSACIVPYNSDESMWIDAIGTFITTQELYTIFLQQKSAK